MNFDNAETIGITISRFPEVDTRPLIEAAWEDGKTNCCTKMYPSNTRNGFSTYSHLIIILKPFIWILLEPIIAETESVRKNEIDLANRTWCSLFQ